MRPGVAILLSTTILALLLAFLAERRHARADARDRSARGWSDYVEAFVRRKVTDTYVDELDEKGKLDAFYRAMDAYVRLDDYCDFIPPLEYKQVREETSGRYAGLGVKINMEEDGLHIVGILPGGPADKAGLKVGDTLVRAQVNKADEFHRLAGRDMAGVTELLKGDPNSVVRVQYIRGPRPKEGPHEGPRLEVDVTRALIRPPTVFTRRVGAEGAFLVVRLTDFTEETADDFDDIMTALSSTAPAKGVVIDLRNNGGGVLGVAVRVAGRFLRKGRLVVRMEGRGVDASRNFPSPDKPGKVLDLPVVVLVNGKSASASEVVAGALQDHRRAILVGTRTYGKFLVQSIFEIASGNDEVPAAALKLTTSRYYTPSGRSYQGPVRDVRSRGNGPRASGLIPDVVIELSSKEREQLGLFWENEEGVPWNEIKRHPEVPMDYVDPQLERAVKLLEGDLVLQRINRGARGR